MISSSGLLFILLVILYGFCCESNAFVAKSNTKTNIVDVKKRIDYFQKHSIKSITSQDGDIIDCIDIYKQPAFDHPSFKNHKIQMTPSNDRIAKTTMTREKWMGRKEKNSLNAVHQLWQRNGSCPKGTVPIRRLQEQSLIKANPLQDYGRKKHQFYQQHASALNENNKTYLVMANHSTAILLTVGFSYSGAKGDIKVWNPSVETDDEYSTSQVTLKNGPYYDYESIEFGTAVNPSVYGDRQTRLFSYWTADASKKTGCFDLTCPGFVQTSHEIALGAAIYPISTMEGLPYQITVFIYKDPITSNWWVQYGEKTNVGYWPGNLFEALNHHAESVEWGGEVYSSRIGSYHPHTTTQMGNGRFPDWAYAWSGCVRRMRVEQNSMVLKFPDWVSTYTDEYGCYDVRYVGDYIDDPEFFYGGPGRNLGCP